MKYADVDGVRREASRKLVGKCPICEVVLTPRCGRFRQAHWAHPPGSVDHRWEPETEWHRQWKACFPEECQEVVHRADNGERHIADVKTVHGHVVEFQNSPISEEERSSREAFYRPMVWVANGQRLKNDRKQFFAAVRSARILKANPLMLLITTQNCLLLRKWENSRTLVLFDFGEAIEGSDEPRFGAPVLWVSHPGSQKEQAVITPVFRQNFLDATIKGETVLGINCANNVAPAPQARRYVVVPSPPRWPEFPPRKHRERKQWAGYGGRGSRGGGRRF